MSGVSRLDLADGFAPPIELMTQKIAILARTGAGKTNTATVIAEEVLQRKQQVVALDPKGDWWGLRSSADGKEAGYPITVLGGDHGDLPLEPTAGALIADVAADGVSMVIDLSAFTNADMRRFVVDFAERFYRAKAQHVSPVLLVLEEADEVVPQRFAGDLARMVGAIERIVKRGRFRGIGTLLVTQRSASLNKDVLTQTEVLIVQQTTAPQDKKAIDAWVESHPDQDKRAELMANIASLKKGEAFVWSPTFLEIFQRVRFRMRRTFDAGRDVKIGELRTAPKVLAPIDLAALGERMKALGDRAKADDPRVLRERIRILENEARVRKEMPPINFRMNRVEVPVLKDAQIARLEKLFDRFERMAGNLANGAASLKVALSNARSGTPATRPTVVGDPVRAGAATPAANLHRPRTSVDTVVRSGEPRPTRTVESNGHLPKASLRMLSCAIAMRDAGIPITRTSLGAWSGINPNGGYFDNVSRPLKQAAVLDDRLAPTSYGQTLVTPAQLDIESVRGYLKGKQLQAFDAILAAEPAGHTRESLGEAIAVNPNGGYFDNLVRPLRQRGVITDTYPLRVAEALR